MNLQLSYISSSERKDFKKFLLRLLWLGLIIFVLDKAVAFWATQAVLNDTAAFGGLSLLYQGKVNTEIIMFGSSKTHCNIDAKKFEQDTGLSSYNLAIGNAGIDMTEFMFDEYLIHNQKPKIVFIEADYTHLNEGSFKFRSELLAPFSNVSSHTSLRLNKTKADRFAFWFFRCKNLSSGEGIGAISRSMLKYLFLSENEKNSRPASGSAAGYQDNHQWEDRNGSHLLAPVAFTKSKEELLRNTEGNRFTCSENRKEFYRRIVATAQKHDIAVVLYGPPLFGRIRDELAQECDGFFSSLAESPSVEYLLFRENAELWEPELWNDRIHLNLNGAEMLTAEIITRLNSSSLIQNGN